MTQAITIKDEDGNYIRVDATSGAMATETQWQELLEEGKLFSASHIEQGIGGAGSLVLLIRVGTTPIHFGFRAEGTAEIDIHVHEGPTVSANGTSVPAICRNRVALLTTGTLIFHSPTTSDLGLLLLDEILANAGVRELRDGFEFIFAANTDYIIELDNLSGGQADAAVVVDWFEDPSLG